jgi:hypothetical protein
MSRGRTIVARRANSCEEGYGCGCGRNMVVNKDMLQRRTVVAGEGIVAVCRGGLLMDCREGP